MADQRLETRGACPRDRRPGRRLRSPRLAAALAVALLSGFAPGCQQSTDQRLEEVRSLHDLGAWEESVETLRAVLEEHPDHPEANFRLGVAQVRLGRPSLAIWPLQLASRDPEFAVKADLQLTFVYFQLDQHEATIEAAGRVLDAEPEEMEQRATALQLRASTNMERDRPEEALADLERVGELKPDDPGIRALRAHALVETGRAEEAGATLRELWEAGPEEFGPLVSVRSGLGLVSLYEQEIEDPEAALRQLEAVLERHPAEPEVVATAVSFFEKRDQRERATRVLRTALETDPSDIDLRMQAARRMASWDQVDEGEALLEEGTELLGSPEAWLMLQEYRAQQGDTAGALAAVERALELLAEPTDVLRFQHADLLVSVGQLERADGIARELRDTVYGEVLQGRIAFERGEFAAALEHLDAGLRRWPNNPGARYLAGKAAFVLGDLDRARSDLLEAVRVTEGNSDAGLDLARIHLAHGEPEKAYGFAIQTASGSKGPGGSPERVVQAAALAIRALLAQGEPEWAKLVVENHLTELPEGRGAAQGELAAITAQEQGPGAAADLLEASDLDLSDPEHLELLRALGEYRVQAGDPEAALDRVREAVAANPESPGHHDLLGRLLARAGRAAEASDAFGKALELDSGYAPALEGRARLAQARGETAQARELLERAAELAPERAEYPYAAAQIALASGDPGKAEEGLRETLRRDPSHAAASNDLAWILADRGESLDEALALARRAAAGRPTANVLDTLGWVQLQRGEPEAAAATLERAHALDADSPSIAYRLALALARAGDEERARSLLEEALASGSFPEAEAAREQLARLGAQRS